MAAIPYTIINKGETVIITLNFTFSTPAGVELHADFSSIKSGESTDFTGTVYSITGLHLDPLETTTFSVDYTALSGVPGVVNGSIDIEGLSRFGDSDKLVGTIITLIAPPPIDTTNISVAPTTGTYSINLGSSDGPPRTGPPPPPPIAPVADFVGEPLSGFAPLTVNFTDLSTNTPTGWFWSFGNGQTSYDQNPSVTYGPTESRTFNVSLSVFNEGGSDSEIKNAYINVTVWPLYVDYRLQQTEMSGQEIAAYGDAVSSPGPRPDLPNYTATGVNPCDYPITNRPEFIFMVAGYTGLVKLKRYSLFYPYAQWGTIFDTNIPEEQLLYTGNYDNVVPLAQQYFAGYIPTPIPIDGTEYFMGTNYVSVYTNNFTMYYITCPGGVDPDVGPYPSFNSISMSGTQSRHYLTPQEFVTLIGVSTSVTVTHLASGQTKNYNLDFDNIMWAGGSDDGYDMLGYRLRYMPES